MSRQRRRTTTTCEEEAEFRRALDAVPPPTPPDGGWGWVVVFASFMINAMVDGTCYNFGMWMPALKKYYGTSYAIISLSGSLLVGVCMLSGPLISALCNKFGSRRIAIFGSIIAAIALILSLFSSNPTIFFLLYGICGGVGFGMMFLAAIVTVGFYFEKRRGIAATITMCGSGLGTAAMAPVTVLLLKEYEWKGALLMLSGIILNGAVLSCLYRPLDADLRRRKKLILRRLEEDKKIGPQTCIIMQRLLEEKRRQRTQSTGSLNNVIITRENMLIRAQDLNHPKHSLLNRLKVAFSRSNVNLASNSRASSAQSSRVGTPSVQHKNIPPPHVVVSDLDSLKNDSPGSLRRQVFAPKPRSPLTLGNNGSVRSLVIPKQNDAGASNESDRTFQSANDVMMGGPFIAENSQQELVKLYRNVTPDSDRPMYRKDIYYTGSVQHLPQYHDDVDEYVASITSIPDTVEGEGCFWRRMACLPKSMKDVLRSILDLSTFQSSVFICLSIASYLTMLGYYVPFVYLPLYALQQTESRTDMQSAMLLVILGVSNTVGRVLAGFLAGKQWIDSLVINNIALILAGGATAMLPFISDYNLLCVYAATFGACVAAFSSLRSVIVVELMGLNQLTTSFSQLTLIHGLAVIAGTPIAGYLFDVDKNFNNSFYFAGTAIALSGFLCVPLRKIAEVERRRKGILTPSDSSREEMKKPALLDAKPQEFGGMESVM